MSDDYDEITIPACCWQVSKGVTCEQQADYCRVDRFGYTKRIPLYLCDEHHETYKALSAEKPPTTPS